jgi:hypothetical protein
VAQVINKLFIVLGSLSGLAFLVNLMAKNISLERMRLPEVLKLSLKWEEH